MRIPFTRRLFIACGLALAAHPVQAQNRSYDLVPDGSRIRFIFSAGGAEQDGTLPIATADIRVDTGRLTNSSAEVTADIRKIKTSLILITQAIKSPQLLHAEAHPLVRFRSTRIRLGAAGRISEGARIEGDLTLRGVTRPISLAATLSRPAGTQPDDLSVLFIQLTGTLSRAAFGATGYSDLAEDAVALDIRAELRARA